MAKVMISIPDQLLERVDARAGAAGETRSGFLQRLAERELAAAERDRRREVRRLLDALRDEFEDDEVPIDAAQMIREDRDSH